VEIQKAKPQKKVELKHTKKSIKSIKLMKRRLVEKIKEVNDEKLLRQIDDSLLGTSVRDEISLYKR
jgi:hypothetical protein